MYSTTDAANAGLDLEMPGPTVWRKGALIDAVRTYKVRKSTLDDRVRAVLKLVKRASINGIPEGAPMSTNDNPQTSALLRRVGADSIVLLKNEHSILPLKKNKTIAVIGPNAKRATYCGGGSASLLPYYAVSPYEGICNAYSGTVKYTVGAYAHKELPILPPQLVTADGRQGVLFNCYNEPPGKTKRRAFDTIHKTDGNWFMVDYKHPDMNEALWYATVEGYITPEEDCEYDFGLSVCGTATLYVDDKLVVDNETVQRRGTSFFGMGTAEEIGRVQLKKGIKHKVTVNWGSRATMKLTAAAGVNFPGGGLRCGAVKVIDTDEEIQRAVDMAKTVDQVVLCVGLNVSTDKSSCSLRADQDRLQSDWESEGHDRQDMRLKGEQDRLIQAVCTANPNTAVVSQSGTPVSMPWIESAPAILQAWYGGNETGNAIADVLFGTVNPSGKLPLSFPIANEDNPAFLNQTSEAGRTLYGEDIYVGYRFYDRLKRPVLFPFGHGLSYTTFEMSNLQVQPQTETTNGAYTVGPSFNNILVRVAVKNTGPVTGAEVVQVYVSPAPTKDSVTRPVRELRGFAKVFLRPGETQTVDIQLERKYATSYWNEREDAWVEEKGTYGVWVGSSSDFESSIGLRSEFEMPVRRVWRGL